MKSSRKVRVLINPRSGGMRLSLTSLMNHIQQHWHTDGREVTYQLSKSAEDGKIKTRRAIQEGIDTLLVVGGDGMINSVGSELVGTSVNLGVIPTGSGNGLARHFRIPLKPGAAAEKLASGKSMAIDVGYANDRPFFVTCSMAWDANIVRSFEKSPVRGIGPYLVAAAYEFFEYSPQPINVTIDHATQLTFDDPMVFTVANLTQYGGGARIAPNACPDDGLLELVVIKRGDTPKMIANIIRLFDGTLDQVPEVVTHKFRLLEVRRRQPSPIQLDGELVDSNADVTVKVKPKALNLLVP